MVTTRKPRKPQTKTLTGRQRSFVDNYLIDLNGKQAAIRAGYAEKYADRYAFQLMGMKGIKAEITKALDERSRRVHLTQDEVLSGVAADFRRPLDDQWSDHAHMRATELAMKHLGMLRERVDIDHRFPSLEDLLPGRLIPPQPTPEVP